MASARSPTPHGGEPTRARRRRFAVEAMSLDPFGFFGPMFVLVLALPLITTVLIVGVIVWAIRRSMPPREDPAVAELKSRLARGEIDLSEYQARMDALERED